MPTIAAELSSKIITSKYGNKIKAQIWDTAGQEKYSSLATHYFKKANGVLLVCDLTNINTFKNLKKWVSIINDNTDDKCLIYLIGNKKDLDDKREVTEEMAKSFIKENRINKYYEVSVFDNTVNQIENVFEFMLNKIDRMNFMSGGERVSTIENNRSINRGLNGSQVINIQKKVNSNEEECSCC